MLTFFLVRKKIHEVTLPFSHYGRVMGLTLGLYIALAAMASRLSHKGDKLSLSPKY